jgi:hypothetical protein
MSVERDQLTTSSITDKIPSSFIDRHGSVGQLTVNEILNAFKDGVTDGLIYGERDEKQESYYYKQGYDFGLTLYGKLNKYLEDNNIRVSKNNEK